ncbi:MAG TPA: thiamine phosphate synthase [Devosiaceae bacterium]|nr:thiamine phosphate synthase [Devosiaceae bacterium]
MHQHLYLITPPGADAGFAETLGEALDAAPVAAVLIPRGGRPDAPYADAIRALVPVAQARGAAALADNDPALARAAGADGVHMTGGVDALKAALAALQPDFIVGAGAGRTRHDAMLAGEAGADYVFFGTLGPAPADDQAAEMARWWVNTFEIPAVWFAGDGGPGDDPPGAEFLALRGSVWDAAQGPAAALARFAATPRRGAA